MYWNQETKTCPRGHRWPDVVSTKLGTLWCNACAELWDKLQQNKKRDTPTSSQG